jgi:hypothetical protein
MKTANKKEPHDGVGGLVEGFHPPHHVRPFIVALFMPTFSAACHWFTRQLVLLLGRYGLALP